MREIKFRAWDLDNFNMHYQDRDSDTGEGPIIWTCQGGQVFFEENQLIDTCPGGMYHEQEMEYRRPNQAVMQFTGLLDKNGKEIYEGDLIRRLDYPLHVVEWPFYFVGDAEREYEVFGNIHENPDLLKEDANA